MFNEYFDIVFRSIVVYLFIVFAIRLFGKKEIAQLSVADLVFILLISNAVQNAMVGPNSSLPGGLIAAGSLFLINMVFKFITYKSKKASKFVEGTIVKLIQDGKVIQENIDKERITREELEAVVREHGVDDISKVNLAVLEVDGNISILTNNYTHKTTKRRKAHRIIKKEF
jgi:uncharacterized membrane protein YcaP (DUF421 family)